MSWQLYALDKFLRHKVKAKLTPDMMPKDARAYLEKAMRFMPALPRKTKVEPVTIAGMPGERVSAAGVDPTRVILHFHGGVYVMGSVATHRNMAAHLSALAGAPVFLPEYRLAPEHPFPAAVEDACHAYGWVLEQGFAPERIALSGDSAGGGLVFASMMALRDENAPLPAALASISAWTDLAATGQSLTHNLNDDPMLNGDAVAPAAGIYLSGHDAKDPLASPLYGDLRGLPPCLMMVGASEVLKDDTTRMADRLEKAGVDITLEVWPDVPHIWPVFAGRLPEGKSALKNISGFFQAHWSKTGSKAA